MPGSRLVDGFAGTAREDLEPMSVKGLFHDHVRVAGTKWLLRLPRASQFELSPGDNLDYQAACFAPRRARAAARPPLAGRIEPRPGLAWGGLVVAAIEGGPARLPGDLASMAGLSRRHPHALPVPPEGERRPLAGHTPTRSPGYSASSNPQSLYFDRAGMSAPARAQIAEELAWARSYAARHAGARQPVTLSRHRYPIPAISLSSARRGKRARCSSTWEKALFGSPAIDVAHASLYTSTMWDADCAAALTHDDLRGFYTAYLDAVPPGLAAALRPWLMPMRRLTWLRSMTWFAKWRVRGGDRAMPAEPAKPTACGGGPARRRAPGLVPDIGARIDGFLRGPDHRPGAAREWLGSIDFAA